MKMGSPPINEKYEMGSSPMNEKYEDWTIVNVNEKCFIF